MLGLPAGAIPLTPEHLRATLFARSAAFYGVDEKTMRNIRSSLGYVLRAAGVIDRIDTSPPPLGTNCSLAWLKESGPG